MEIETERRWLVEGLKEGALDGCPAKQIAQAYASDQPDAVRVRIVNNGERIEYTQKKGGGIHRQENTEDKSTDLVAARFLMQVFPYRLAKIRTKREGYEVDQFEDGPLKGLTIVEYEAPDAETKGPPDWAINPIEVTDSITNLHLAIFARNREEERLEAQTSDALHQIFVPRWLPRVVLTGGPCAGKTTAMEMLRSRYGDRAHFVPEVATIVIGQVGVRPDPRNPAKTREFQRLVYNTQRGFEDASHGQAKADGRQVIISDRGVVDGAAYMPEGLEQMTQLMGVSAAQLYARYDMVLCLEVPPEDVYNREKANNPSRFESFAEARALGERIEVVWGQHPHFKLIPNGATWDEKYEMICDNIDLCCAPRLGGVFYLSLSSRTGVSTKREGSKET